MVLTSSSQKVRPLNQDEKESLLDIADASIGFGLNSGHPLELDLDEFPEALRRIQSTFVTLKINEQLRGCIGSLEATRPLAEDVSRNAFQAAFGDFRFPALNAEEYPKLSIQISLLSPCEAIPSQSREEVLRSLRPGIDGVLLFQKGRAATFLPEVWETIRDPVEFLRHLRCKAGLDPDAWPPSTQVYLYTTEKMSRSAKQRQQSARH